MKKNCNRGNKISQGSTQQHTVSAQTVSFEAHQRMKLGLILLHTYFVVFISKVGRYIKASNNENTFLGKPT